MLVETLDRETCATAAITFGESVGVVWYKYRLMANAVQATDHRVVEVLEQHMMTEARPEYSPWRPSTVHHAKVCR